MNVRQSGNELTHCHTRMHSRAKIKTHGHTNMANHPKVPAKNPTGEFGNFTKLLDKLLSVPHSKIKAELEAEKSQPRKRDWSTNRAKRRHAYRDADDAG